MTLHVTAKTLLFPALLFVAALAILPVCAHAEETAALGERADSSLDALKQANQYSFETGGIGIIMSYGTKNGVSAEEIGDAFVNEFQRRGEKARYFFYNTDRDGMALSFRIRYSSMGPWDADTAASQVSKVVARAQAARNVHGR